LSKTIGAIDGVDAVTVHLVIPEDDLFGQDDTHPSASVLVRTRRGQDLDAGQVQAVVHLVASSVEGLVPGEVTVADSAGRVLSAPGADGASVAAGDARTGQVVAFEQKLASSVEEMLGTVVGTGHAVVRVSADLDFDERNTTIERFETPEAGATAVTEATTEETYTGTGGGATGVLGVDGAPIDGAGEEPTDYTKAQAERTFAVGKVTEQVKAAPGAVRRLSVAVLLDGTVDAAANQADIERLVSAAAGLDPARDTIQVGRMPFDTTAAESARAELAEAEAAAQRGEMVDLARTAGTVAIVALVLLLLARSVRKASRRAPVVEPLLTAELDAARAVELVAGAPAGAPELALVGAAALPAAPEEQRALVANHIGSLIDQQPDEVAQLLRGWLGDRRA
jgi:flagellar M-ring protein FliF